MMKHEQELYDELYNASKAVLDQYYDQRLKKAVTAITNHKEHMIAVGKIFKGTEKEMERKGGRPIG